MKTSTISSRDLSAIIGMTNGVYQINPDISPEFLIRGVLEFCGDLSNNEDDLTNLYGCLYHIKVFGNQRRFDSELEKFVNIQGKFSCRFSCYFCKCCSQCFSGHSTKVCWNHLKSNKHLKKLKKFDINAEWIDDEKLMMIINRKIWGKRTGNEDNYIQSKKRINYREC